MCLSLAVLNVSIVTLSEHCWFPALGSDIRRRFSLTRHVYLERFHRLISLRKHLLLDVSASGRESFQIRNPFDFWVTLQVGSGRLGGFFTDVYTHQTFRRSINMV